MNNAAGSREEIRAAIVKAEELRAIHAALLHGTTSPTTNLSLFLSSPPATHHFLRPGRQYQPNFPSSSSVHDYPVFTPNCEDEPSPGHQQIQPKSRAMSESWAGYGQDDDDEIIPQTNYTTRFTQEPFSRKGYGHLQAGLATTFDPLNCPVDPDCRSSVTSSCTTNYNLSQLLNSTHLTEAAAIKSRRKNSLGGDFNSLEHGTSKLHHSSNIIFPLTDTHVMSVNHPQQRTKSRAGKILSWLLPRFKKKPKGDQEKDSHLDEVSRILSDQFGGGVSVDLLKEELVETCRQKNAALVEVAEIKSSFGDLKQKLENLESYCRQLKRALRKAVKSNGSSPHRHIGNQGTLTDTNAVEEDSMPVTNEVMLEGFLQMVSEARTSVKHFCKMLLYQVDEADDLLLENLNHILHPHNLSINPKQNNKSALYHLEAIMNQALFQDFENCVFQKNGSPKLLNPHQARLERFSSFVALRNLSWDEVLEKGTKYYSEDLSKFCDRKMSCVITLLNWTSNPWPQQLLQSFFIAAKCIWRLHLLAFSFHQPLRIMRVEEDSAFDHHYMDDLSMRRQRSSHGASWHVKVMVMPGFYVHDKVLRCKVLCRSKLST